MDENTQLTKEVKALIRKYYVKNRHHVVSLLLCGGGRKYIGLHLDTHGLDICAESSAMAAAIIARENEFLKIISVYWNGKKKDDPQIITPCGNCRQLLFEYAPNMEVITKENQKVFSDYAKNFFPYPYKKPSYY